MPRTYKIVTVDRFDSKTNLYELLLYENNKLVSKGEPDVVYSHLVKEGKMWVKTGKYIKLYF